MSFVTKRTAFLLLGVILVLSIAGCGGDSDQGETPPPVSTESPTSTVAAEPATPTPTDEPATPAAPDPTDEPADPTETEPAEATPTPTSVTLPPETPTSPPVDDESQTEPGFAYGFNIFARGDENGAEFNAQTIQAIDDAGFGWIRIQIYWREIQQQEGWWDPLPIDRIVEQYQGSGIKILASISAAPEWARDPSGEQYLADYGDWETFVAFLAERYAGRIDAWEIWNEQNLAYTIGGYVRLTDYCQLLEHGYNAIKAASPESLVLFAGLTPTGVNDPTIAIDDVDYLRSFYELDGGRCAAFFDVLGAHGNATNNPPDAMYPDNPGTGGWSDDPSFYFRRVEQLHDVMAEFGDDRPIWITEFGWTTANQAPGYEYGNDVSEQDQAEYLVRAFEIAHQEWPWCTGMFVWNLNFSTIVEPEDEKFPWSVLNQDWSPRPAYIALTEMIKLE